jgi:hypothetical protein
MAKPQSGHVVRVIATCAAIAIVFVFAVNRYGSADVDGPRLRLTLRAVAVPTRVIRDGLMAAGVTPIEMSPQRGGVTARDRPKDHRCCALSHGCCSRTVWPCAWRISATSTAGRLTTAATSAAVEIAAPPVPASRATAQAAWAPRGDAVATDGDTPSCATGRRGPAAAESCADRSPLPTDVWRTSAGGCAG